MEVVKQVKIFADGMVIEALGKAILCVITCDAVAVQPLEFVTVTVYVPGVVTESVAFVPTTAVPFDQE